MRKWIWMLMLIMICISMLSWCGKEEVTQEVIKKPYYLTVEPLTKSDRAGTITKNAKVLGTSEITITSLVAGRVNTLPVKLGSMVGNGQTLAQITDTNGTIRFGVEKSQLAVDSAQNSYVVQKATLEKQIKDSQLALERAQVWLTSTLDDATQQRDKIEFDLANVNANVAWSNTQLQLEKLQKDLIKAQLDYQTKLDADSQNITNFTITAGNIFTDVNNLVTDIITESDKVLWVSNEFRNFNDNYEVYLGGKDLGSLFRAKDVLVALRGLQNDLDELGTTPITQDNIVQYLNSYRRILDTVNLLVSSMKDLLIATPPSLQLPQSGIDWLIALFNGLASKSSAITSSITAQVNGITTFVVTYQQGQQSIAQQINILKDQIGIAQKWLEDAQFTTQLGADRSTIALDAGIQNAQLTVDGATIATNFVQNTKDLNLQSIQNQLESAKIALRELDFNQNKYRVSAPIAGIISDVLVDVWQDVNPGTPIATIVSNSQQLEVNMTRSELEYITVWQTVVVSNEFQTGNAVIETIARVADKDGTFKLVIALRDDIFSVGSFVDVEIPLYEGNIMIPINAVNIVDANRGQIYLWDGSKIINQSVTLGQIFGIMVAITDPIQPWMMLITSDIENYDETKYILEVKQR